MKKNQFNNKEKNKYLCDTAALLAMLLIAANTYSLIMFHYYFTYEENLLFEQIFDQTPKSSYLTIIQHNPVFLEVYVLCDITLLFCGIYRLRIKKEIEVPLYQNGEIQKSDFTKCIRRYEEKGKLKFNIGGKYEHIIT